MRHLYTALAVMFALGLTVPALGQATVLCQGNICGGAGATNYQYDVSVPEGQTFYHLHIGTCDTNINNYSGWVMPQGWSFMGITSYYGQHNGFTAHGAISTPTGPCNWALAFGGPNIQQGVFGFNNSNPPHDTFWEVVGPQPVGTVTENWAMPVGTGAGPVHGPAPEPGSLLALGSGLLALAGTIIRRRR